MEDKSLIIKKLENEGISVTKEQCDKLYRFYEMVIEKNKVMNLTAITDYDEFVIKHFVDSLMIAKVMDMQAFREFLLKSYSLKPKFYY